MSAFRAIARVLTSGAVYAAICIAFMPWSSLLAHERTFVSEPVAARITAANAASYHVEGIDAQGGIGDWFLSNGVICAVISDPSQESVITYQGGFLTDLGFCNRGDDHLVAYYPALNMSLLRIIPFDHIEASLIKDKAVIRTVGEINGLRVSVSYSAEPDLPDILSIHTLVERVAGGEPLQSYGEAFLTADSMQTYDVSIARNVSSNGFAHVSNELNPAKLTVLLGTGDPGHNIVYGYRLVGSELSRVQGDPVTPAVYNVTAADYTGRTLVPGADLAIGDRFTLDQQVIVASGAAVSPITDKLWSQGHEVTGSVGENNVVLLIEDTTGSAVTHVISDSSGMFAFRAPEGNYRARVHARGRTEVVLDFSVEKADVQLPAIQLQPRAVLNLPKGKTMRLSFRGLDGAEDPDFIDHQTGYQVKVGDQIHRRGSSRFVFLSADPTDPQSISLAPGKYLVTASRGPEFSVHQQIIELASGKSTRLAIGTPERQLTTGGYLSADFHVHSGRSFDNNLDALSRLKSFVAQGAEVLVSTEHDTIYDFTQLIKHLGLTDRLKTVAGTELTTELGNPTAPYGLGHANVFPLREQPLQPRRGAPRHENHRWRDIIAGLHGLVETPIVQLNHPRDDISGGVSVGSYFSHMSMAGVAFDTYAPLTSQPNNVMLEADTDTGVRDIDFDVIEIENGNRWGTRYEATRNDWFSLLRQGIHMVAAANSDSHGVVNGSLVANVRNMVFVGADDLADYSEQAFIRGIRSGNLFGTNGPMLDVSLNGIPMGGLASGAEAILQLKVDAPDWIQIDHYRLYINGELVQEEPVSAGQTVSIPLEITEDAFVTVEVTGPITDLSREVIGDIAPLAFSNPVYFDADGDHQWTPIGSPLPR